MPVGGRNRNMIESSDGMLAVLEGTDVDSGRASETGCAFALGRKILGYRGGASREITPAAPLTSRSSTSYEKAAAG